MLWDNLINKKLKRGRGSLGCKLRGCENEEVLGIEKYIQRRVTGTPEG